MPSPAIYSSVMCGGTVSTMGAKPFKRKNANGCEGSERGGEMGEGRKEGNGTGHT